MKSIAMRKLPLFSAMLILFLLVPASITWAQTISSQKGLTTAIFPTQYGNVKIYLPDDIRAGDVISGTIIAEPKGNNARQTEKNLIELKKYTVSLDGNKYTVPVKEELFKWIVPPDRQLSCPIELLHISGVKAHELTIQLVRIDDNQAIKLICAFPSHVLAGEPMQIKGSFDGDASNTNCELGNQSLKILTESPRQLCTPVSIDIADPGSNRATVSVRENGKPVCSSSISIVNMQVTHGELNLRKGQSTYIDVKLTGLQNLPDTAMLTITNITPNVVTMTSGNVQSFPIFSTADSMHGTFSVHCPAVSIATGTFAVNIDLDLPDVMLTPGPGDNQDGKCKCTISASIIKPTTINFRGFHASLQKNCGGQNCSESGITKNWEIISGRENIESADLSNDKGSITVQPKGEGPFTLKFSVILTCSDGSTCTDIKYCDEKGDEVKNPVDEGNTDEPRQPTEPQEPKNPTEPQPGERSSKCKCGVKAGVQKATKGNEYTYTANVQAECKGVYGKGGSVVKCDVAKIEYEWKITSGEKVAEIDGKSDGRSVKVKIKDKGQFNMILWVTVTCIDGTFCKVPVSIEENIPDQPVITQCVQYTDQHTGMAMTGGLNKELTGMTAKKIRRDDFITMYAQGKDADMLVYGCEPIKPPCDETKDQKNEPLNSWVRFEWRIMNDTGSFVQLGCLPDAELSMEGDRVIFKPPYVPLPVKNDDTTIKSKIELWVIDDNLSQPVDAPITQKITINIKRSKKEPDDYTVQIVPEEPSKNTAVPVINIDGTCKALKGKWELIEKLPKPEIILPEVSGKDTILIGQLVVLTIKDIKDKDRIPLFCDSKLCTKSSAKLMFEDEVGWKWDKVNGVGGIDNGSLILGSLANGGRYVIYKAPDKLPEGKEFIEVKIRAQTINPAGGERKDPDSDWGIIVLKVYQPGIKLTTVPLTWLPDDKNKVEITSRLMVKAGGWKIAPDHACRIQFFEMLDVSNEKGVCMNSPQPDKANLCRDLKIKNEKGHEAFDTIPIKGCPDNTGYFLQARTQLPVHTYKMIVYSEDFGSWAFLRSFANVNPDAKTVSTDNKRIKAATTPEMKGAVIAEEKAAYIKKTQLPWYIPVPITSADASHPSLTTGRGKYDYTDNRVSIPLDLDVNHIADGGWTTIKNKIDDPPFDNEDNDEEPVGDGTKGDGLTNYEEYRGFMTKQSALKTGATESVTVTEAQHKRTDPNEKTIFIHRVHDYLDISLFESISKLETYLISESQYNSERVPGGTEAKIRKRWVNFNYTRAKNVIEQWGLKLVDAGTHASKPGLQGIASNLGPAENFVERPSPPNWEFEIRIYTTAVKNNVDAINKKVDEWYKDPKEAAAKKLDYAAKLRSVVAHELLHGCNVCHHGERVSGKGLSSTEEYDVPHGLRSGDIFCVMHYDNIPDTKEYTGYKPEPVSTGLCSSPKGTGYNTAVIGRDGKEAQMNMGNATRGDCAHQIRVTARSGQPPACNDRK